MAHKAPSKTELLGTLKKMRAKGEMLHDLDRIWLRSTGLEYIINALEGRLE